MPAKIKTAASKTKTMSPATPRKDSNIEELRNRWTRTATMTISKATGSDVSEMFKTDQQPPFETKPQQTLFGRFDSDRGIIEQALSKNHAATPFLTKLNFFKKSIFEKQSDQFQKSLVMVAGTFQKYLDAKQAYDNSLAPAKKLAVNSETNQQKSPAELKKEYEQAAKASIKALEKLEYAAKPLGQKIFEIVVGMIGFIVGAIVTGLIAHIALGGPLSPTGYVGAIVGFAGGGALGFAKGIAIGAALFAFCSGVGALAYQGAKKVDDIVQGKYEDSNLQVTIRSQTFFKPDRQSDPYMVCRDMVKAGVAFIDKDMDDHAKLSQQNDSGKYQQPSITSVALYACRLG